MWSKTKSAERNRDRPQPIPRPGDQKKSSERFADVTVHTVDEVRRRLALPRHN